MASGFRALNLLRYFRELVLSNCPTILPQCFWVFFRQHLFCPQEVYLLAGDEVVVTKAVKKTYGIERFFSSLDGQYLSGLSFFALSLVSIQQRRSFPIRLEQIIKSAAEKVTPSTEKLAAGKAKKKSALKIQKIAKNRCCSALYLPYEAPKTGKKSRRKYGEQLKFSHIPAQYLKESTVEENIKTKIYQAELLHKKNARFLNVALLVKTHQITG